MFSFDTDYEIIATIIQIIVAIFAVFVGPDITKYIYTSIFYPFKAVFHKIETNISSDQRWSNRYILEIICKRTVNEKVKFFVFPIYSHVNMIKIARFESVNSPTIVNISESEDFKKIITTERFIKNQKITFTVYFSDVSIPKIICDCHNVAEIFNKRYTGKYFTKNHKRKFDSKWMNLIHQRAVLFMMIILAIGIIIAIRLLIMNVI